MNDRGILATYLMSPLSKITNPENTSQYKIVKHHNSNRVSDLLIKNTIPITLYNKLLRFLDTRKEFQLKGDLLKTITNENYNVDHASLTDKKILYDFAKGMNFDLKAIGKISTRDRTLIKLLKSPCLRVSASGVLRKIFLSSNPFELCGRLKVLLQQKQAGINSDRINQKIVAIVDKLLEYKCICKKQHKQLLIKGNLVHK